MLDVAIVGGGLAGTCAAHALARAGAQVALIDRSLRTPNVFRAEKIEADQAQLLRDLDLLQFRTPEAPAIGTTINFDGDTATPFDTLEQYGIAYGPTINRLRANLPPVVERRIERVEAIVPDPRTPEVRFRGGTALRAKLVVLATGGSPTLLTALGIRRIVDPSLVSLSFGFDIAPVARQRFDFGGFNYYLLPNPAKIDYVTIFPIGDVMRVNLFTQLLPDHSRVRQIRADVVASLYEHFPGLCEHIGQVRLASKVQTVPTVYHRVRGPARDGVVIIGEEFQSVSPTTGKGLSRVLTDVKLLCQRYAPRWLEGGAITRAHVRAFYRDPTKVASDRNALDSWMHYHNRMLGERVPLGLRVRQRLKLLGWTG